jgi:F0F1-type ATP synthase assembly protein I
VFFTKADVAVTILGPAILGAILGIIVYRGIVTESESPLLLIVFIVAGMLLVSLAAYAFRRLVIPKQDKDETV